MEAKLDLWYEQAVLFLPNLVLIVVILIATRLLAKRTQRLVTGLTARTQAPIAIGTLLGQMARLLVVAFGILLVLGQLGLSGAVLSFITGLGITGIIIGFALQDIVKQFAAGMLLLMLQPFRIGDNVKIGAFEGQVTAVQFRATTLKTLAGEEVLIPNADVYTTAITNRSRYELLCHEFTVTLPDEADPLRMRASLSQALQRLAGVAREPTPIVVATGLESQAVKLTVRFWTDKHNNDADTVITTAITTIQHIIKQGQTGESRN